MAKIQRQKRTTYIAYPDSEMDLDRLNGLELTKGFDYKEDRLFSAELPEGIRIRKKDPFKATIVRGRLRHNKSKNVWHIRLLEVWWEEEEDKPEPSFRLEERIINGKSFLVKVYE